ncbi:MAG: CapA family protein [Myxococcales bacterium]|nr:CapA family protein [Myxococcales bacterium]MCB9751917.1 CapA family protein [Myxococcales bacterium]
MGIDRAAIALLAASLLGCASPGDGETEDDATGDALDSSNSFAILWVGDTLLADAAQDALDRDGYLYPFVFLWTLADADFSVGNAEGPITTISEPYYPDQTWSYNARPNAAEALASFGFDAMSLANNHLMDRGPAGVDDTRANLAAAGIEGFGAGGDADEAAAPLWIPTPYGLVAVIGMAEVSGYVPQAGADSYGAETLSPERVVTARARALEGGARWVVAFVHWGNNYDVVEEEQRAYAEVFVAAGYDLVIGHGAHVPQRVELIAGVPVLYSLGNFVFGTPGRFSDAFPGRGLVATTRFDDDGLRRVELRCILTDNDEVRFQPRPCGWAEARELMAALGPAVRLHDAIGVIER